MVKLVSDLSDNHSMSDRNCNVCLCVRLGFVLYMNHSCDRFFKFSFMRTLHVHNVARVVVQFQLLMRSEFGLRVHRVDVCEINSVTSFVVVESSKYKTSFFDVVLEIRVPDVVAPPECLCIAVMYKDSLFGFCIPLFFLDPCQFS